MYPPPTPRPFIGARRSGSGAPTPTTPRRSPPALKRRGLRAASQHRPLYSFLGACATCRPLACRLAWAGEAPYHSPGQNARVKCTAPPLFLLGGAALAFCPRLLRQGAHPEGTGPLPWPVGPAGPGVPAGTGPTINGSSPLLPCWEPHYSTASRVCARRSRPATHPAGAIYASPRFFSCCRAPPSRAFNSVWARPLTVPCFLGTAQQGRKGYNTCISQVTQQ